MQIQQILVPQGAEHQAVLRGLQRCVHERHRSTARISPSPQVIPIPIGWRQAQNVLHNLYSSGSHRGSHSRSLLLMGLGGSLIPALNVGDVAVLTSTLATWESPEQVPILCDRPLVDDVKSCLGDTTRLSVGLTSDRLISAADQKHYLAQTYHADVVEMEAYGILHYAQSQGLACAVVRVIGDDCHHDLPDVTSAIASDGTLRPLPLAWSMIRRPVAARRLIQGSLRGLQRLEQVATQLCSNSMTSSI